MHKEKLQQLQLCFVKKWPFYTLAANRPGCKAVSARSAYFTSLLYPLQRQRDHLGPARQSWGNGPEPIPR